MQISLDRRCECVRSRVATKAQPQNDSHEPQDQIKLWERTNADFKQGFGNLASAFQITGWPTVLAAAPSSLLGYVSPNLAYVNLVAAGAGALLTGGIALAGLRKEAKTLDLACQQGATHTTGRLGNGNLVAVSIGAAKETNSKARTFSKAIAMGGAATLLAGGAAVAGVMSPALAVLAPLVGVAPAIPRVASALLPDKLRDFASSVKRKLSGRENSSQCPKNVNHALCDVESQHPGHIGKQGGQCS